MALVIVGGLIAIYFGVTKNNVAAIVSGAVICVVGIAAALYLLRIANRPDRGLIKRWARYLTIPETETFDYQAELDGIKKRFDADGDKRKNRVPKLEFAEACKFCDFSTLENGEMFFGCLVQANDELFEPPRNVYEALPAVFIYSRDEYYKNSPEELIAVADELFRNKANNSLRYETKYEFNSKVDESLTDGREVLLTDILVYRYHLPLGVLGALRLLPIIARPDKHTSAFIVDCKYWSDDMISKYLYYEPEREPDRYGEPFDI